MNGSGWRRVPLKRVVNSVRSGTSVNGAPWPASDGEPGVLKTSAVYGGVFNPDENKQVDEIDIDRVSCPVLADSLIVSRMNTKQHLGVAAAVREARPNLYLPDRLWSVEFHGAAPRFIDWWTKTDAYRSQVEAVSVGTSSSMQNISQGDFLEIRIDLPDSETQRAIAYYLDRETSRIDTLIEEQQRLIELLRERRAAVLSAVFDIGSSTQTTKVGRLLAVRPTYGVLVPTYVDEAEGVPFVRVGDLLNLTPGRPMLAIMPEQSAEYSRTKLVGGEVLLGVVGKMGQAVLAPDWLAGANVARAVAVLRCKDPSLAPLICAWLGSTSFLHQAEVATSGDSIQSTLGMKDLAQFDINLPTDPKASADLANRLAHIDALIAETERFIGLSKERRAALITAAVTGQIDVREGVTSGGL